jgi:hypothetical protein
VTSRVDLVACSLTTAPPTITRPRVRTYMFVVYWLHDAEHESPHTDGYIGITGRLATRVRQHRGRKDGIGREHPEFQVTVLFKFAAPEIPTADEEGVPGLHVAFWHGLWTPRGTSKDIIAKLNRAVVHALADPTVRQRFADYGQEIPPPDQQNTGCPWRSAKGRNREMVADHQGRQDQGGISCFACRGEAAKLFRRQFHEPVASTPATSHLRPAQPLQPKPPPPLNRARRASLPFQNP